MRSLIIAALLLAGLPLSSSDAEARSRRGYQTTQNGVASFYARKFHNRRMADGTRFNINGTSAASRTLPLGTSVRVTNRTNGRTARLTIRDRGPYVGGRILDVSPAVARGLGFHRQGVARVTVQVVRLPPARARRG